MKKWHNQEKVSNRAGHRLQIYFASGGNSYRCKDEPADGPENPIQQLLQEKTKILAAKHFCRFLCLSELTFILLFQLGTRPAEFEGVNKMVTDRMRGTVIDFYTSLKIF